MSSPVKIASLELENVKRVKAVELSPAADGLTVIGGRNAQGKTSVLDAIAWALGGNKMRPGRPNREGSATPARLHVELSNGLVVERSGKNGSLKVTDPSGKKSGQALLDGFIGQLALDLPRFMNGSDREKAETLLGLVGVGGELDRLDREIKGRYDRRTEVSRQERTKRNSAAQMPYHADAPAEPVSASELIERQQAILARNGENARKRGRVAEISAELDRAAESVRGLEQRLAEVQAALNAERDRALKLSDDYMTASKTAEQLRDESTAEVEAELRAIDELNEKVRENRRKADAEADADALKEEADALSAEIDSLRRERTALLAGADMPLEGLTVDEQGRLSYKGSTWGDMSSSEQLRVAAAVAHALKPECGFVLVDELERFDPGQLAEFGSWAEAQGLQVIGTRVATDGTCTIVIEDGRVAGQGLDQAAGDAPADAAQDAAQPAEKKPDMRPALMPLVPGSF
ncbi:AAA family ATPase [Enorma phocaeensis]|uniref:AAA family ATPase n=1 Tax=Enorma phocaeensis TaxID=1871019 RepID=UPI00235583A1|nr:AAA family ATPase [Enorma phocaeensis]